MTRLVREGKNQALKARAVAQARIKELEDRMAELNGQHADQVPLNIFFQEIWYGRNRAVEGHDSAIYATYSSKCLDWHAPHLLRKAA